MILVDTSIWVDHLRNGDATLASLLEQTRVLAHPWVRGELAIGHLRQREEVLRLHRDLLQAVVATHEEILALVDAEGIAGSGIGYVDVQLLAATRLTLGAELWTADRALKGIAQRLRMAFPGP